MAGKYTIGAKIVLEGEKEYKQAINNCNSAMRVLKSELKAVSAEYANNANTLEALRAKNDVLTKQQEEQEKKLALLRGALEKATQLYGENSEQVKEWQIKLNNAYAELQKINRELSENERYLREAENSTDKTAKSIDQFGKKIKDAGDGADEFGKNIKEAGEKTSIFGDVLKANLLSDAIMDGLRKLGSLMSDALKESIELASDLTEVQNVVDVTFGKNSTTIDEWSKSLVTAFGISELEGKRFVGTIGAMLKSMGTTEKQVVSMSEALVELAGDMASFYNLDVEEAFNKIRSGISGETEPLKQLGINLNVANLEAYALSQGIKKAYNEMSQAEQVALRYNYLMQVTADVQGDFARNADSYANQQRILNLQWKNFLTELGGAIVPGITQGLIKLNEELSKSELQVTDAAEAITEGLVDALIWIIDNADTVISGLKGIAAAFITKKAADGVEYAVKAYKALTTATEAATAAQATFNSVSKANVIGAIASVVIGLGTALYTYSKNAKDAAESTNSLLKETRNLIDEVKKLNKETEEAIKKRKEEATEFENQYEAARRLASTLYELADKETKSNAEKSQMAALVKQLNELVPELNLAFDEQTGILSKNEEAVKKIIEAQLELQRVQFAGAKIAETELSMVELENKIKELNAKKDLLKDELEIEAGMERMIAEQTKQSSAALSVQYLEHQTRLYPKRVEEINSQIREAYKQIETLKQEHQAYMDYIGRHNPVESIAQNSKAIVNQFKASVDDITSSAAKNVEDAVDKINDLYEGAGKELEKRLKKERKAFEENQEAQVKAVQKAQKAELKTLEEAHKKKLEMINEEYLEKLKNVDEERYNELKKLQDQIDALDAQQEAEDRAAKLREEASKRAELKARVENAKTIEERLEAQEELAEFEEEIARDRLKTERQLQKNILKEQMDKINEAYDAKVKALEEEQKKARELANEQYEAEKEQINTKYQAELEALKKIQEEEKESFNERQEEYKEFLRKQKELAIEKAKETYEEDLRLFKLNNSLKEKEISQSDYIKSIDFGNIKTSDLLSGKYQITSDMLYMYSRYGAPTSKQTQSVQGFTFDYDRMANEFAEELKKLNLTVVLDGKKVGTIVRNTVDNMIK